uniref:holo-[acyl-carrier-protein] synthase n=1 Tax=Rhizophora mucronata TaxID=61149 RepID=A0A2P2JMY7_RHIMU
MLRRLIYQHGVEHMYNQEHRANFLYPMNIHCFFQRNLYSSSSLSTLQLPSRMETHIWYVVPDEIRSAALLNRYMEILPQSEKDNVLSMSGDHLQKRVLLARALVRTTIARYQMNHHVDPRTLKFRKNNYGKPEHRWSGKVMMRGTNHHYILISLTLLL